MARTPVPPLQSSNIVEQIKQIVYAIQAILNGKLNSTGTVTLDADSDTTTVTTPLVATNSCILLTPTTEDAGAECASGALYISARTNGVSFTIHHSNAVSTTRTFEWCILGAR